MPTLNNSFYWDNNCIITIDYKSCAISRYVYQVLKTVQ